MSTLLLATLLTFVTVGVLVLFLLKAFVMPRSIIDVRLDELRRSKSEPAHEVQIDAASKESSKLAKTVASVSEGLPISTQTKSQYKLKLIQAGYRNEGALSIFFGLKVILSVGLFAILMALTFSLKYELNIALALGILGFIGGLLLPNVWLNSKLRTRQTEIFHALPDVLDLMTVCVEAGLGLDSAIIKISEEKQFAKQVLADEFRIVSREIRAGKPRVEAMRDLGERTGVDDIKSLVALLIQTDRLGASLARSLRVHSDSLRTKRRQIAEEAAAKTSIKLIFPLAFCIFPALFVVLLGPAAIRIYDTLLAH